MSSRMASPGGGDPSSSSSLGVMTPVAFPPPRTSLFSRNGEVSSSSTPSSQSNGNGKRTNSNNNSKKTSMSPLPPTSSSPVGSHAMSPRVLSPVTPPPPEPSSSSSSSSSSLPPSKGDSDSHHLNSNSSLPPPPPSSFLGTSPSSPSRAKGGRNKKQRDVSGQKTLTLGMIATTSPGVGGGNGLGLGGGGLRGRLTGLPSSSSSSSSSSQNGSSHNSSSTLTTTTPTPGSTTKTGTGKSKLYGGLHAAAFPPLSAATGPGPKETTESELIGGLPSLWEVYCTPDTKVPYFYNAISKHVQWHVPVPPKEYVDQLGPINIPEVGPIAPLRSAGNPGGKQGGSSNSNNILYGPLGSNLFVFHIPTEWTEPVLFRHFAPFGNVVSCKIQTNTQTGRRSGFGFVSYDNPASAIAAIRAMNGYAVCGKFLKVQLKKGEEHLLPPDLANSQQQQSNQQHGHSQHQSQLAQPTPPPLTPQHAL
ncbi:rna recognition motif-containing protein [Cystoisospora suis]|uniref:Rna recognition motif-containing protein n=1 Tax=Cystoisospora suis TaxID=483139 RepID=A0A2C6KH72_9APIC|nr:rna recognition motif-containing protein [Cystoisospora suis]